MYSVNISVPRNNKIPLLVSVVKKKKKKKVRAPGNGKFGLLIMIMSYR
jgi:hypothetical protein